MTSLIAKGVLLAAAAFALVSCKEEDKAGDAPVAAVKTEAATSRNITTMEFALRTASGRELMITARADCRVSKGDQCITAIGDKLQRAAAREQSWQRVEALLPVASADVRSYALFSEEAMERALAGGYKTDLYTVTAVRDCATGAAVPTLTFTRGTAREAPPPEEPKAQAVTGKIAGGQCVFQ